MLVDMRAEVAEDTMMVLCWAGGPTGGPGAGAGWPNVWWLLCWGKPSCELPNMSGCVGVDGTNRLGWL